MDPKSPPPDESGAGRRALSDATLVPFAPDPRTGEAALAAPDSERGGPSPVTQRSGEPVTAPSGGASRSVPIAWLPAGTVVEPRVFPAEAVARTSLDGARSRLRRRILAGEVAVLTVLLVAIASVAVRRPSEPQMAVAGLSTTTSTSSGASGQPGATSPSESGAVPAPPPPPTPVAAETPPTRPEAQTSAPVASTSSTSAPPPPTTAPVRPTPIPDWIRVDIEGGVQYHNEGPVVVGDITVAPERIGGLADIVGTKRSGYAHFHIDLTKLGSVWFGRILFVEGKGVRLEIPCLGIKIAKGPDGSLAGSVQGFEDGTGSFTLSFVILDNP